MRFLASLYASLSGIDPAITLSARSGAWSMTVFALPISPTCSPVDLAACRTVFSEKTRVLATAIADADLDLCAELQGHAVQLR